MNLRDKRVLVTGASRGIGRAIALAAAEEGAELALTARTASGLQETQSLIEAAGGRAHVFPADLRSGHEIETLASEAMDRLGSIDMIAHVAGVWHDDATAYWGVPLAELPPEQIDEVLDVGIRAPMQLTHLLLPQMISRGQGKILAISGTFASGGAGWLHYYVSKLALEHMVVGLAQELRPCGIQVNCVSPSDVATDVLKRFFPEDAETALEPEEVAKLAMFLMSEAADNITGQVIVIKSKRA